MGYFTCVQTVFLSKGVGMIRYMIRPILRTLGWICLVSGAGWFLFAGVGGILPASVILITGGVLIYKYGVD